MAANGRHGLDALHEAVLEPDRGRAILRRLLDETVGLRAGAHLIVEIGHDQGDWLASAVEDRPAAWRLRELIRDYAGISRTAVLHRRGRQGRISST